MVTSIKVTGDQVVEALEIIAVKHKLPVLLSVCDGGLMLKHEPSGTEGHGNTLAEAIDDFSVGLLDGGLLDG